MGNQQSKSADDTPEIEACHLCGMAFLMEQDEAFDPLNVGLFGAVGIVPAADSIGNLVEQFTGAFSSFWIPLTRVRD